MNRVLFVTPGESQWWSREGGTWGPCSGESDDPVWVVTDLAEESLTECKVPRLFGRDRSAFVRRQVAGRYPDTPFCGAIPNPAQDDPLGALMPTRYAMFGIDAAERLNAELDAIRAPVAGVWPLSMLMGVLASHRSLPPDLFVVLPGSETLRIVYLRNRIPILTRMTLTPDQPNAQVEEIVRTIRHLENTQAISRDAKGFPVVFLGDPARIDPFLAPARLVRVELPQKGDAPAGDWHNLVFDLVLKSPVGQVAPLARRVGFLSARLSRVARYLALLIFVVGVLAASSNLFSIYRKVEQRLAVVEQIEDLDDQIDGLNAHIARYGAAPDIVRKAVALTEEELDSAPDIEPYLRLVSQVIARDPNLRIKELQWRLIAPGVEPCVMSLALGGTSGSGAEAKIPGGDVRRVELGFELGIPGSYGPRDRALTLRAVSSAVAAFEGVNVFQDANKEQASGSLRGGSIVSGVSQPRWCLTLPGTIAKPGKTDGRPAT
jgi:hypothetical protein